MLWKGYNPAVYYKTLKKGKYCKGCNDWHQKENIHQLITGSQKGTTFPAIINQTTCNALIDTGTSRSCISEAFYKQLNLPPIQELHVRSVTGGSLSPLGTTNCTFKLGEKSSCTLLLCLIIC